jgi:TatD DNase family protein
MLVDSHCHLDRLESVPEGGALEPYMQAAAAQDVGHMLCVSIDMENWPGMMSLIEDYQNVSASVGVHPNENDGHEPDADELVRLAAHPKIIAIGETGLDYFRSEGDLAWQRERFRVHIEAAKRTGKPLIIHSREARDDTIKVMRETGAEAAGGVMHCFTEDWDMARAAMDLNFYISFSGIVTFKSARTLQDVAQRMPLERMLIETDSPYLAPVPHRGKPNQPAYVRHVAEFIAALRGVDYAKISTATTENFFRLFRDARQAG